MMEECRMRCTGRTEWLCALDKIGWVEVKSGTL